jgi:hypothetical protein
MTKGCCLAKDFTLATGTQYMFGYQKVTQTTQTINKVNY